MRSIGFLIILLLCGSQAHAQTMLEQARMRGAAAAQSFDDDPTSALPEVPWTSETNTSSLLGVGVGLARLDGAIPSERHLGVGAAGQLRHAKLEQPLVPGLWGQSWAIAFDAQFGAESQRYFGLGNAQAQFGTLATLASAGHALYFRFAGDISIFRDSTDSVGTGFASIPVGARFNLDGAALEFGIVPALGWVSLFQDARQFAAGPLFFGAQGKWQTRAGWLEVQHLRGVSPANATVTTLLACGNYRHWTFCGEGSWPDLHDLGHGDQARFARVGIRIGLGSWHTPTERSLRPSLVRLR